VRNLYRVSIILLSLATIYSCKQESITKVPKEAEGYRPIYGDPATIKEVKSEPAKPVGSPGKIYYKGGYIFQVDEGTGIHIVNTANPSQAGRVGFISIKGCHEIAITGNYLFTNNLSDLITVDISDFSKPKVVKRISNAFTTSNTELSTNTELPPERGYFECPDKNKGIVVGWRKEMLQYPKCSNF